MTENNKYSKEFLNTLKQLCLEFDSKAESYPDPDYVGFALYFYATHPGYDLHNGHGGSIDIQTDWSEGGTEWVNQLNKSNQLYEGYTQPDHREVFVFVIKKEELDLITMRFFCNNVFKKDDFFKGESPDWLADTFILKSINEDFSINHDSVDLYQVKMYSVDELYVINKDSLTVIVNKDKHEVVEINISY